MVAVEVGDASRIAHGDDLAIEGVVPRACAADDLLPAALEGDGRHAAHRLGNPLAVGIVGVGLAAHTGNQVVGRSGITAPTAAGQVAIGVVEIARATDIAGLVRPCAGAAARRAVGARDAGLAGHIADGIVGVRLIVGRRRDGRGRGGGGRRQCAWGGSERRTTS